MHQTVSAPYYTENASLHLGINGLVAGIFDEFDIDKIVNNICPKTAANVKVSSSELLRVFVMCLATNPFRGLMNLQGMAAQMPIQGLIKNPDVSIDNLNRYAFSELLDAISYVGPESFMATIVDSIFKNHPASESVSVANVDSTSFRWFGLRPNEFKWASKARLSKIQQGLLSACYFFDSKALEMEQGYSRDRAPELLQINAGAATVTIHHESFGSLPIPVFHWSSSGNENDIKAFQKIINEGDIKKALQPFSNLKYIVGDSALFSKDSIIGLKLSGFYSITRVPDRLKLCKEAFAKKEAGDLKLDKMTVEYEDGSSEVIEAAWAGFHTVQNEPNDKNAVTMKLLLVNAETMRDQKTKTLTRRAEKELEKLNIEINKHLKKPFGCEEDALREYKRISKTLKLCELAPPVVTPEQQGNSKSPKFTKYKLVTSASINQNKLNTAIERELLYVIATSNLSMDAKSLYKTYHTQSEVEGLWKDIKANDAYVDALYLKSPSRIRALVAVEMVTALIVRIVLGRIRKYMEEHRISLTTGSGPDKDKPNWFSILNFPGVNQVQLKVSGINVEVLGLEANSVFNCFIEAVGEHCEYYYLESNYEGLSDTFLETVAKASTAKITNENGESQPFTCLSFKDRMALKAASSSAPNKADSQGNYLRKPNVLESSPM